MAMTPRRSSPRGKSPKSVKSSGYGATFRRVKSTASPSPRPAENWRHVDPGEMRVGGKYRLEKKLGSSSSGDTYLGFNLITGDHVIVKLESIRTKKPQLLWEAKIYKTLKHDVGIPVMHWYGVEGEYNVLIVETLGPSLQDLFTACNRQFSLKTILLLADQMLSRIEDLHSRELLHRAIKPENFLIGLGEKKSQLYIVDFGAAKIYRDHRQRHIPYSEDKSLKGAVKYASLNAHRGLEMGRRDDLEALGYVLIYFLRGTLPWFGIRAGTKKEKYKLIEAEKMKNPIAKLVKGRPTEFVTFINHCRKIKFEEQPDYKLLKVLLTDLAHREGLKYDYEFEWNNKKIDGMDRHADKKVEDSDSASDE